MATSRKIRRLRRPPPPPPQAPAAIAAELSVPDHFRCPISLDLMRDPVTVSTGITYDRASIEVWLDTGSTACPVTSQQLATDDESIIPNHSLRRMIQDWCVANQSRGVERIPTPRIPLSLARAVEIVSEIESSATTGDLTRTRELAARVKALAKESERNRRNLVAAGAGSALASAFRAFVAGGGFPAEALEETLAAMTGVFPLDQDACWHIGSPDCLGSIVSMMRSGDIAVRAGAVLVVRELVSGDKTLASLVGNAEGLVEGLVRLIREPISPQTTKAGLTAAFFLINSDDEMAKKLANLGLVPAVVELLVGSERSVCEKALAVLDGLCRSEQGRKASCGHALAVPALAKKMFRVSEAATELAVSALWRLCREECKECVAEALQVGAFQKLLLLLQVGCSAAAKEKATELLKLLNGASHGGLDCCIDVMDFKGLKRSL